MFRKITAWFIALCLTIGCIPPMFGIMSAAADGMLPESEATAVYDEDALLAELYDMIAENGLSVQDVIEMLRAALASVNQNLDDITAEDLLLPPEIIDQVVEYILSGFKELGVEVNSLLEKISSNKVLEWFIVTYTSYQYTLKDLIQSVLRLDFIQTVKILSYFFAFNLKSVFASLDRVAFS